MKRLIMRMNGRIIGRLDKDDHGSVRVTAPTGPWHPDTQRADSAKRSDPHIGWLSRMPGCSSLPRPQKCPRGHRLVTTGLLGHFWGARLSDFASRALSVDGLMPTAAQR